MKRLILTRHSKSSWDDPMMPDHDRPLWADLPHGEEIGELLDELHTLSPDEARAMLKLKDRASVKVSA